MAAVMVNGWAIVDLFLIPRMVRSCNSKRRFQKQAENVATDANLNEASARPLAVEELKQSLEKHTQAVAERIRQREEISPPQPEYRFQSAPSTTPIAARPPKKTWDKERYEIEYADADGVVSTRTIDVLAVRAESNATYIQGWCHTRRAERTFRSDRILSARRTGDACSIGDAEQYFNALVPEVDRPDPDHDVVMSRVAPGLGILVWIAKVDREITVDEESILFDFIEERNGLAGPKFAGTPWNKSKAAAWIDTAKPTFNTSSGTLGKISKTGREYAMLNAYAIRLADEGGEAAKRRMKQLFRD